MMSTHEFWLARDFNGQLYLYSDKPVRGNVTWQPSDGFFLKLPGDSHPEVKWLDDGPTKVTVNITPAENGKE